jgi:hypothetical protein
MSQLALATSPLAPLLDRTAETRAAADDLFLLHQRARSSRRGTHFNIAVRIVRIGRSVEAIVSWAPALPLRAEKFAELSGKIAS